jgi:hypothetical protein
LGKISGYLYDLFKDKDGDPSMKRYMCLAFAATAIVLASLDYGFELVAVFVAASLGENIASVFERGGDGAGS